MKPGKDCDMCNGRGWAECLKEVICTDCGGTGKMRSSNNERDCYTCNGRGKVSCFECGGTGRAQCHTCGGSGKRP